VVFGSLLGAATIHLVFLACGTPRIDPPQDGGILDAALDAMGMLGDAETRDAVAQEAGGSCACPAPARTTFTGSVDLGSGPVQPRTEFSVASAGVTQRRLNDGTVGSSVTVLARFQTVGSPFSYTVSCGATVSGRMTTPLAGGACSVIEDRDGAQSWMGTGAVTSMTITAHSDTELDVTIDALTSAAGRNVTVRGMRWRLSAPGGGLIPPAAYQP
jgi:hypothetical protein